MVEVEFNPEDLASFLDHLGGDTCKVAWEPGQVFVCSLIPRPSACVKNVWCCEQQSGVVSNSSCHMGQSPSWN